MRQLVGVKRISLLSLLNSASVSSISANWSRLMQLDVVMVLVTSKPEFISNCKLASNISFLTLYTEATNPLTLHRHV